MGPTVHGNFGFFRGFRKIIKFMEVIGRHIDFGGENVVIVLVHNVPALRPFLTRQNPLESSLPQFFNDF